MLQSVQIPETVTVCVTSCGRLDLLAETLTSFGHFNNGGRYLLSEDSADDATIARVRDAYPHIKVLSGSRRIGLMGSIDRLYEAVTTPYIFHLEDDWLFTGPVDWSAAIRMLGHADVAHVCVRAFDEVKERYRRRSEPAFIGTAEFRIMRVDTHPEWFAWSSNPGLIATQTYQKYRPFGRMMHDQMSGLMKKDGLRQAFLLPGVARHIGHGHSVVDPMIPARPKSVLGKCLRSIKKEMYYRGWRAQPF